MKKLIGRELELSILREVAESDKSEFIAIYGRRRVGKTFLVRSAYRDKFTFQVTALGNATKAQQITNFHIALRNTWPDKTFEMSTDWLTTFQQLESLIASCPHERKIIFFDELPWFDTPGAGFIPALEHFWNSWASGRSDVTLVVCGSAASWMINKLIHNRGGLYNRVTKRIKVSPFTLRECELFLQSKNVILDRFQIIQLYMVLGGIPFYWEEVRAGKSASQNIEDICFTENGLLQNEYPHLFRSLFSNDQKHQLVVESLASKAMGMNREEILRSAGLPDAGSSTRILTELEESGFIRRYQPFGLKQRNSLYQLTDQYTLFYLRFIRNSPPDRSSIWLLMTDNPRYRSWSGYAFEQVCLYHLAEIKVALGISGVQTTVSSWRSSNPEAGAQIDLVIDRRDQVITLCEMKYSIHPFTIDKKYATILRSKMDRFRNETGTRKLLFLAMVTTYGITPGIHSLGLVQNDLTMDCLFSAVQS
jgi:uncharacterized protein